MKPIIVYTLGFCCAFLPGIVWSQPDTIWTKLYGTPTEDVCKTIIQAGDGGYLLVGYAYDNSHDTRRWLAVKVDDSGQEEWRYEDPVGRDKVCENAVQARDGDFILAGYTEESGNGGSDARALRLSVDGDIVWDRAYGRQGYDDCSSILKISENEYCLIGYLIPNPNQPYTQSLWLLFIDNDGDSLTSYTFNPGGFFSAQTSILSENGAIVTGGYIDHQLFAAKISANRELEWFHSFPNGIRSDCASIVQTTDHGYLLAGYYWPEGSAKNGYLIKVDENGDSLWTKEMGDDSNEELHSAIPAIGGGFFTAGFISSSEGNPGGGMWISRLDDEGEILWSQTYGGSQFDDCYDLIQLGDASLLLAGKTYSFESQRGDFCLVKTEADPNTVKRPINLLQPQKLSIVSLAPNPFNSNLSIYYQTPVAELMTIRLFDITGAHVETIALGFQSRGSHSIKWDASDCPAGLYFLRLEARHLSATRSVVLLK